MFSIEHKNYLKKIKRNKMLVCFFQVFIVLFFIFIWEYLARKEIINTFILSSPTLVIKAIYNLYLDNNLFHHIWITVYETVLSFSLGTLLGIIIAIILWWNNFIYKVFDPYLTIINSLPKVALGPIIIILGGANMNSIIIMALLISVIITIVTVYNGFVSTNKGKINLLKSLNASKFQILINLILPNSYNTIISSLKISISMSLVGLLPPVGEKIFF